jgi:hypothetical protein
MHISLYIHTVLKVLLTSFLFVSVLEYSTQISILVVSGLHLLDPEPFHQDLPESIVTSSSQACMDIWLTSANDRRRLPLHERGLNSGTRKCVQNQSLHHVEK